MSRVALIFGAAFGGMAVALGAFAAHGLDGYLVELYADQTKTVAGHEVPAAWKYLQDFQTAARYQMSHALALIGVGLLMRRSGKPSLRVAGVCFLAGTVVFSGALYLLVLTGQRWLGAVAPIGGTLLIIGWIGLLVGVLPGREIPVERDAGQLNS